MKRIVREALNADLATARQLLADIHGDDFLGRLSISSRIEELEANVADLNDQLDTAGEVALFFTGEPVTGSRAIDADFAGQMLSIFQNLVSKSFASDLRGIPGARGPVALRDQSNLVVTDIARGSFGFVLEEATPNADLADSAVKIAISDVTSTILKTSAELPDEFEEMLESLDPRMLKELRDFFVTLDDRHAAVRIVGNTAEVRLEPRSIVRARTRVERAIVNEREVEEFVGELIGVLTAARKFEMRRVDTGEVIKGSVDRAVIPHYEQLIHQQGAATVGRVWSVRMRVREVQELNRPVKIIYTLLQLVERR